jgi:hypothetical protein
MEVDLTIMRNQQKEKILQSLNETTAKNLPRVQTDSDLKVIAIFQISQKMLRIIRSLIRTKRLLCKAYLVVSKELMK